MGYRVDIKLSDGTIKNFGTFVSESYTRYHMALAKCAPDSIYRADKYKDAEWIITKEG